MSWKPFVYRSQTYDLSHLEPHVVEYVRPASGGKPEQRYRVRVTYTDHCFTRKHEPGDDDALVFRRPPHPDARTFDFRRYALSKSLRGVIEGLMDRRVIHGVKNNFLTVELADEDGNEVEYEVYFRVYKDRAGLNLEVQTAFPRDPSRLAGRPRHKPIKFGVILYNVQTGRRITVPR